METHITPYHSVTFHYLSKEIIMQPSHGIDLHSLVGTQGESQFLLFKISSRICFDPEIKAQNALSDGQ